MKILDRVLGKKTEVIDMDVIRARAEAEQAEFEATHRVPYAEDQRRTAIEQRIALILKAK